MQKYFQAVKLKTVQFCILTALALLMSGGLAHAQDKGSNLSLADSLYFSALDSLFGGSSEPLLRIQDSLSGEAAFLRSGWIRYWSSAQADSEENSPALVVVMDRFAITIDYFDGGGRLLGWSGKMKRHFAFSLQGWLENTASRKVVRSFAVHKTKNDFVDAGRLSKIEKSPFRFTKGTMKTKSVWMRYIQPAVVIGAVSAMVYLFFSVRT